MKTVPVGFSLDLVHSALGGGDIAYGPSCGVVGTVWTPQDGIQVEVPQQDGRDFTVVEARQLHRDLGVVLGLL